MYREFFNLTGKPFSLAADPRYLYMSQQHWEAMAHLMYGVDDNWGFVLITGEVGTGKTTLCRFLLDQIPEDVETAFLINPKLTEAELLVSICQEFGISCPEDKRSTKELFDSINTHLLAVHARAHKALLIIDEAQYLSVEVLDQLRLLTNLESEDCKLLRIILLGQPELRSKLSLPELKQMSQRITARYHLDPLAKKDVASYVAHRMAIAGAKEQIFTKPAIQALCRKSKGVPRLINVICDRALLGACMKKQRQVTRATLLQAADEVFHENWFCNLSGITADFRWIAVGLAVGLLGSLLFLWRFDLLKQYVSRGPHVAISSEAKIRLPHGSTVAWWPVESDLSQSRETAYRVLIEGKGVSYYSSNATADSTFCADMELLDMRCINRKESGLDLHAVSVPAVLQLSDAGGNSAFAVLQALHGDKAKLRIGDTALEVPALEVRSVWTGEYMMLEQFGQSDIKKRSTGAKKTANRHKGK